MHVRHDTTLTDINLVKGITKNLPQNLQSFGLNYVELLVQLLNS